MFNIPIERPPKPETPHPWAKTIKAMYADRIKRAHNSIRNATYPKIKEKKICPNSVTFAVIGNRTTKEFIHCVNLVKGMHTYKWKKYKAPIIRGCTAVEWEEVSHDLKLEHGGLAHCLDAQVAVLCNNKLIGGVDELKDMIESKYIYHLVLNYQKESVKIFADYLKSSGRPCAYMHISVNGAPIGSLIFMLYSDVVPATCDNFLRLCNSRRGGYSGTPIHRIVKGGWIQGGGFGLKNTKMTCENFIVPHNKRGVLGMANAGRDVECSTQFYVLLEPNDWLMSKFVAFGQLIDGEETLKKIEEIETYYEAPLANITITMAGVLNIDCHDIRIHRGALEYLDGHVDDLVAIGELFYEMLMENVYLEIEFRRLQREQASLGEGLDEAYGEDYGEAFLETVDADGNPIRKNIEATRRYVRKKDAGKEGKFVEPFLRKKDEIEQQFTLMRAETNQAKFHHGNKTGLRMNTEKSDNDENNDFDVDSYHYENEEYTYQKATPSSSSRTPKEKRPYYIPFTDVPYPGEVDSTYDLKKMLKGDYCLESDLDPKQSKIVVEQKGTIDDKINAISGIISTYGGMRSEESFTSESLSSDEEQELMEYLNLYEEKVSFSGNVVRHIAKKYMKANPVEDTGRKDCFTDDDLRMMRMALKDFKSRGHKKVSLNVQPWSTSTQIKRRQTGFAKPEDMAAIRVFQRDADFPGEAAAEEEDETKKYEEELEKRPRRSVSIVPGPKVSEAQKIERRPTGYFPSDVIQRTLRDDLGEEEHIDDKDLRKVSIDIKSIKDTESHHISRKQTGYYSHEDFYKEREEEREKTMTPQASKKSSVRIAPSLSHSVSGVARPSTYSLDNRQSAIRQSVLVRLLEDLADDDDEEPPTLKDYKPHETGKKQIKLAMSDADITENTLLRKSTRILRQASDSNEALKRVPSVHTYNQSVMKMEHVGYELLPALRGHTRSKLRPTLTVTQYQKINEERRAEAKKLEASKAEKEEHLQSQGSKKSLIPNAKKN